MRSLKTNFTYGEITVKTRIIPGRGSRELPDPILDDIQKHLSAAIHERVFTGLQNIVTNLQLQRADTETVVQASASCELLGYGCRLDFEVILAAEIAETIVEALVFNLVVPRAFQRMSAHISDQVVRQGLGDVPGLRDYLNENAKSILGIPFSEETLATDPTSMSGMYL